MSLIERAIIRVKAAREEVDHAMKGVTAAQGAALAVSADAYERALRIARNEEHWLCTLMLWRQEDERAS